MNKLLLVMVSTLAISFLSGCSATTFIPKRMAIEPLSPHNSLQSSPMHAAMIRAD